MRQLEPERQIPAPSFLHRNRCPHCRIHQPSLAHKASIQANRHGGDFPRTWHVWVCASCGGAVCGWVPPDGLTINDIMPFVETVSEDIPERARNYLQQAIDSVHSPSGSIMLSASSIDAMLKEKGYKKGDLFPRIERAAKDHLITEEMAAWAHDVRLDANDQRHADEQAPLPTEEDAQRAIDFTQALAEFLFVLPARVRRGRKQAPSP